jgi:peptidoglycan-associated lipoprotein
LSGKGGQFCAERDNLEQSTIAASGGREEMESMTMIRSSAFESWRKLSVAAICVVLAACSTTQKSSTGAGLQATAPISEAATPDASTGKPSNSTGANAGASQGSADGSSASADGDDAAQLKRQLADQDAQINKLRSDQLTGVEQEEPVAAVDSMDAAKQPDQQSAAGAKGQSASGAQDEMAVFPSAGNTAEGASGQPGAAPPLERSVYFGYDQSFVPEKYDSMLLAHAAYLKAHPDVMAEVHGHCDDRGSREYNLALGSRRAESVKRALELAGADGSRISAISYGSEKPVATGRDEDSYSQNRRADIFY